MSNLPLIDPALPFIDLARQHNIELPGKTVEEIRPHVQVMEPQPGLMAFIAKMSLIAAGAI